MGESNLRARPDPVKLFCGLFGHEPAIAEAIERLSSHFGQIDCQSPLVSFEFTAYYRR